MQSHTTFRNTILALATVTLSAGATLADEPAPAKARPTRTELRDKQYDLSIDARDIERILNRLKRASELSKQRITEAAEAAEGLAGAIERDPIAARARAEETAKMFQEIAKQLEALLTEETPQKVAAARNIAAQLAKAEQQFAEQAKAMANNMQSAPSASGKNEPDQKEPPNPNGSPGKGGSQTTDPKTQPQDGANSKQQAPDVSPKDQEAGGKKPSDPSSAQNPEETGADPKGDAGKDKNNSGKGQGEKQSEQPGTVAAKPKNGKSEEPGIGTSGKESKDKDANPRRTDGGGVSNDPEMPPDEKDAGNSTVDNSKLLERKSPNRGGSGSGKRPLTEDERREQLAGRAADLAARASTLLDILESISQSEMPEDRIAAEKVNALLKETDLKNSIPAMQAAAAQVRGQKLEDAQATALDVADRFQIATQRLDAVYRALVGPQAEELRKLEQQVVQLRNKLEELQTPAQVVAWHRAVRELLDKAEELGISEKRRDEMLEEMEKNGINLNGAVNLASVQFTDGRYSVPTAYNARLVELQEEIQSRIQSLVLGDFASTTDDLAPPKYQGLVERYYQVLSRDGARSVEQHPRTLEVTDDVEGQAVIERQPLSMSEPVS